MQLKASPHDQTLFNGQTLLPKPIPLHMLGMCVASTSLEPTRSRLVIYYKEAREICSLSTARLCGRTAMRHNAVSLIKHTLTHSCSVHDFKPYKIGMTYTNNNNN